MADKKGMSKAHQRQTHRHELYYTRQREKTVFNKATRQWKSLLRDPHNTTALKALLKMESGITLKKVTGMNADEIRKLFS